MHHSSPRLHSVDTHAHKKFQLPVLAIQHPPLLPLSETPPHPPPFSNCAVPHNYSSSGSGMPSPPTDGSPVESFSLQHPMTAAGPASSEPSMHTSPVRSKQRSEHASMSPCPTSLSSLGTMTNSMSSNHHHRYHHYHHRLPPPPPSQTHCSLQVHSAVNSTQRSPHSQTHPPLFSYHSLHPSTHHRPPPYPITDSACYSSHPPLHPTQPPPLPPNHYHHPQQVPLTHGTTLPFKSSSQDLTEVAGSAIPNHPGNIIFSIDKPNARKDRLPSSASSNTPSAAVPPPRPTTNTMASQISKFRAMRRIVSERDQQRRVSHSAIERRRRERINSKIGQLRRLVPSCRGQDHLHKLSVLQAAIKYIHELRRDLNIRDEASDMDPFLNPDITSNDEDLMLPIPDGDMALEGRCEEVTAAELAIKPYRPQSVSASPTNMDELSTLQTDKENSKKDEKLWSATKTGTVNNTDQPQGGMSLEQMLI